MSTSLVNFSGAVKLADVSDYIAPAQSCVVALESEKKNVVVDVDAEEERGGVTGEVSLQQRRTKRSLMKGTKIRPNDSDVGADGASRSKKVKGPGFGFSQVKSEKGPEQNSLKVTLNDCLACSGCVTSAETVLMEQQSTEEFLRVLEANDTRADESEASTSSSSLASKKEKKKKIIVVTLSAQSRSSLAKHYGLSPLEITLKVSGFLKNLGVQYVFEDDVGRDMALVATLEEFWDRYNSKGLPLLTSECPGWVLYAEKTHGDLILPYMSKTRSAIASLGSLTKKIMPEKLGVSADAIYHCFVSPCYDKKLEASREELKSGEFADLDCVLATTEFYQLLVQKGFDPHEAPMTPFDDLMEGEQDRLHSARGSSGGYLEFVFRECALRLQGRDFPPGNLPLKVVRNADFQEITLSDENGEVLLSFALAYGFRNIQNIIRRIKQKKMTYHFVEVMACPSGCLNGGGQMKDDHIAGARVLDRKQILSELEQLYHHSQVVQRDPRSNPAVGHVLKWLGGLRSKLTVDALTTQFHNRSQKRESAAMVIDF